MIEAIEGRGVGAGKSFYVCMRIVQTLKAGGIIYAADTFSLRWEETKKLCADRFGVILQDDQYHEFPAADIPRLHEITPPGTEECPVLIIVDEAHIHLNARDYARTGNDPKRAFFNWLTQSRHDNNDVIFITQHCANMDRQIMRLVTYIIRMRNMANFKVMGLGRWPLKQFVVNQYDQDGKTLMDRRWLWHDKGIFGIYNSKSCGGSHKRLLSSVSRKKLERTKSHSKAMRILIIVAILGGIYAVWNLYPRVQQANAIAEGAKVKRADTPPASSPGASKTVAQGKPADAWEIAQEELRGTDERTYLHTNVAQYVAGEMSAKGLVQGIKGNVVKIVKPSGQLLYIVAERKTVPGVVTEEPKRESAGVVSIADLTPAQRALGGYPQAQ